MYDHALVYTKPNCPHCAIAIRALEKANISYDKLVLNEDFTREELLEMIPTAKTFPQIYLYNNGIKVYIGGSTELLKELF
jgi:glutaredoxin